MSQQDKEESTGKAGAFFMLGLVIGSIVGILIYAGISQDSNVEINNMYHYLGVSSGCLYGDLTYQTCVDTAIHPFCKVRKENGIEVSFCE